MSWGWRRRSTSALLPIWFRVYSPHRSTWSGYEPALKRKLIRDHAALVFEDVCRAQIPGAQRYWERDLEFDLVGPDPEESGRLLVAEIKWRKIERAEGKGLLERLGRRFADSTLAKRHPKVRFTLMDHSELRAL